MSRIETIGRATLHNADCMTFMATLPDKAFDLAIVDPPYGIGEDGGKTYQRPSRSNQYGKEPKHKVKKWDSVPASCYFDELRRVSDNQIIFGANYFPENLFGCMGWVFWDKQMGGDFSDGELAYTSFNRALRKFTCHPFVGTNGGIDRIHPTQKPVRLYEWLLTNYAKPGDHILDTHGGSMSSVIAALNMGFEITCCEIDADYFAAGVDRVRDAQRQGNLFPPAPAKAKPEQIGLI